MYPKNKKGYSLGILSLIPVFLMFFSSCSEWLSIEPKSDLVEEEFWTKKEDIEAVLAATYSGLKETVTPSLIWGELRADAAVLSGNEFADYQRIAEVDIKPSNNKITWGRYYNTINLANTVLFYSPKITEIDVRYTEEVKNGIEAEAIFIRSFCYFYLVRLWKDVPLIMHPTVSDTVDLFPAKSTEKAVLSQLIKDLEKAKDMAFVDQLIEENENFFRGRANKYAIMALLADIYLWDQQYQKCIDNCNAILSSGFYKLLSQSNWFQNFYPGNSQESIFELQFDHTLDQNNGIYNELFPNIETAKLKMNNASDFFPGKSDIRECESSPTWKYQGLPDFVTYRLPEEKDANILYYRLSDIYLMKAEALTEQNKLVEANSLVKAISERAGVTYLNILDQTNLRLYILNERAREFALEGKRWFDVLRFAKRNNFENKQFIIDMVLEKADVKERSLLKPRVLDTMSYYLPIPEGDILYNPELEQNPYYDR